MISMPGKFRSGLIAALALLLAGCASADTSRDAGYMEILTPEVTVYSDSESGSVRFRCDGDWTAYTDESWLRLASDSGTGSDGEQELLFYPDGNTSGEERYGILSIASAAGYANVMVTQSAASGNSISAFFRKVHEEDFSRVYICAHRANTYSGVYEKMDCPENSIPAIRRCISLGLDMVELDVRKTSDGVLVLCHDDHIANVTNGSGKVAEMTYDEICRYDMKIRTTGPVVTGVKIPTLAQALAECKDGIWVNLDLAKCTIPPSEIVEEIRKAGMLDQVTLYTGSDIDLAKEYYSLESRLSCHVSITSSAATGSFSGMESVPLFQINCKYYDGTKDTDGLSSAIRKAGYCSFSNLLDYDSAVRKGDTSALEKFCKARIDFLQTDIGDDYYVEGFLEKQGLR